MSERINEACPWVEVERYAGVGGYWRLTDFWYVPPTQVGSGPANIYWLAYRADGTPAWDAHAHLLNGGDARLSFKENPAHQAEANAGMSHNGVFYPDRGQRGPYRARMDGNSDVLTGMGLPFAGHAQYWGVWKWVEAGAPPVEPPGDGSKYVTADELNARLVGERNNLVAALETAIGRILGG